MRYAFDLWVQQWRWRNARGDVIVVRDADDFDLKERLGKFGLALHPDKTRLIEFGRFAARDRQQRGEGKPETFDFLGFTHSCGTKRLSRTFMVKRKTTKKRLRARLQAVKERLRRMRHRPIREQGEWLGRVAAGYYQYHAIPGNMPALEAFREEVARSWHQSLRRRGQRRRLTWERFGPLRDLFIPSPRVLHPHPTERFYAKHPK